MRKIFNNNIVFIIGFISCWLVLFVAICFYDKNELHLMLNSYHNPFLDAFFSFITKWAEYGAYILVPLLLFKRLSDSLFVLTSELTSGLVVQIIKHIVNAPRPSVVFDIANNPNVLQLVEGVNLHASYSFPSGHTSSFVVVFFALSIIVAATKLQHNKFFLYHFQAFCVLCVLCGAYSRIYLSQHFAQDVFAGGLIAFLVTPTVYLLFELLSDKYPNIMNWKIKIHR